MFKTYCSYVVCIVYSSSGHFSLASIVEDEEIMSDRGSVRSAQSQASERGSVKSERSERGSVRSNGSRTSQTSRGSEHVTPPHTPVPTHSSFCILRLLKSM